MRACFILLFLNIFFISCKTTLNDSNTLTLTELKIHRISDIDKEIESLEQQQQNSETESKLEELIKEQKKLEIEICKTISVQNLCGQCSKCNSICNQDDRINDWLNCVRRGVLAGGKCQSCPTFPTYKHFTLINLDNKNTKIVFRNSLNQIIQEYDFNNSKLMKTNLGQMSLLKFNRKLFNTNSAYDVEVIEILPDGSKDSFELKNFSFYSTTN